MEPQVTLRQFSTVGTQDHGPLDDILELADIARPIVGNQSCLTGSRNAIDPDTVLSGQTLHELLGQKRNIFAPLTQRWHRNGNHVQSEVEILPKLFPGNALLEITVGGGDHANIHPDQSITTHALQLALLKHPEQFGLDVRGHLADFIQQNRATVRQLETPLALGHGPGESPLLMPEELALNEVFRDRRAVHLDERPVGSGTLAVNRPGHQLLAGAALPLNQHRRLGSSDLADEVAQTLHSRAATEQLGTGRLGRIPLTQVSVYLDELGKLLGLLESDIYLVRGKRLDQVIKSAIPHAGHGRFDGCMAGHHDHQRLDRSILQNPQNFGSLAVGQANVHEDQVKVVFAQVVLSNGQR